MLLFFAVAMVGCGPGETEKPDIWVGEYESTQRLFEYCDGVTKATKDVAIEKYFLGTLPQRYFDQGGVYHSIVSVDEDRIVAQVTKFNSPSIDQPPSFSTTYRSEFTLSPRAATSSIIIEQLNPDTTPICKRQGTIGVGDLRRIDTKNRSCKDLNPSCK